eukprot:362203-Chlamydomonas_euryale.AAC.7
MSPNPKWWCSGGKHGRGPVTKYMREAINRMSCMQTGAFRHAPPFPRLHYCFAVRHHPAVPSCSFAIVELQGRQFPHAQI